MPDRLAKDLVIVRASEQRQIGQESPVGDFAKLTDQGVAGLELIVREAFAGSKAPDKDGGAGISFLIDRVFTDGRSLRVSERENANVS